MCASSTFGFPCQTQYFLLIFRCSYFLNVSWHKVGETGSTVVEESQTLLDEIEFTEGYTIDRGFVSPYFVKDQERQACEQLNPRVLVTDKKLDNVQEIVPLLEAMVKSKEPLFMVCEDIVGEALSALVVNKVCCRLQFCKCIRRRG